MASISVKNVEITKLKHDGFKIKGTRVIYTDPYQATEGEKADIVLISHDHYDHKDAASISALSNDKTTVITPNELAEGSEKIVNGVQVKAVPAYNVNKQFHPKGSGRGYVFILDGVKFYHAGDTDNIPEMAGLGAEGIDVAFLPVSGTYVMTPEEAAQACRGIRPKIAIPMHYGAGVVGTRADAEKFKALVGDAAEVHILD